MTAADLDYLIRLLAGPEVAAEVAAVPMDDERVARIRRALAEHPNNIPAAMRAAGVKEPVL